MTVKEWLIKEPIPEGTLIEVSIRMETGKYEDYETIRFITNDDMREFEKCTVYAVIHRTEKLLSGEFQNVFEIVVSPEEIKEFADNPYKLVEDYCRNVFGNLPDAISIRRNSKEDFILFEYREFRFWCDIDEYGKLYVYKCEIANAR